MVASCSDSTTGASDDSGTIGQRRRGSARPLVAALGLADVSVSMDVSVKMAGTAVPGARGTNNEDILLLGEFGYALTPTWTALAAGYHAHHDHGGALTALAPPLTGTIGKLTYAPLMMTATFQFAHWQGVRRISAGDTNEFRHVALLAIYDVTITPGDNAVAFALGISHSF